MNASFPPDDMPLELLAAYVDGELDAVAATQVEAWLREHPECLTDLDDQLELSATNPEFMEAIAPPTPAEAQWQTALHRIEERVKPRPVRPRARQRTAWYLGPVLAIAGTAFALLIAAFSVDRERFNPGKASKGATHVAPVASEDDEEAVFQVARADDVEIIQLPEEAADLIVVGRHPMADIPLVLATTTDVDIYNLGPDDQGRMPRVEMFGGLNAPMVVAHPPRR